MEKRNKYHKELREHFYGSTRDQLSQHPDNGGRKMRSNKYDDRRTPEGFPTPPSPLSSTSAQDECQSSPPPPCGRHPQSQMRPEQFYQTRDEPFTYNHPHQHVHYSPRSFARPPTNHTHSHAHAEPPHHLPESSRSRRPHMMIPQIRVATPSHNHNYDRSGGNGDFVLYRNERFPRRHSNKHLDDAKCQDPRPKQENAKSSNSKFNSKYPFMLEDKSLFYTEDSESNIPTKRTVISVKSGEDLRNMVRSQIEMQELLQNMDKQRIRSPDQQQQQQQQQEDKQRNATPHSIRTTIDEDIEGRKSSGRTNATVSPRSRTDSPSPRIMTERKILPKEVNAAATTTTPRTPHLTVQQQPSGLSQSDFSNAPSLTVSVEDIVATKVITPMIRKIQKMYLNNLREEMALMEDLERVPYQVREVYKNANN